MLFLHTLVAAYGALGPNRENNLAFETHQSFLMRLSVTDKVEIVKRRTMHREKIKRHLLYSWMSKMGDNLLLLYRADISKADE